MKSISPTILINGIERPSINSDGKPIHPTEEGIHNFWKWFGNSKTVDELGRPIVVYHGTAKAGYTENTDIEFFDESKIGDRWSADQSGFFFTNFKKFANSYTDSDRDWRNQGEGGGVVYPVYIKAKNPLIIDSAFLQKEGMSEIGKDEDTITFWDVYQGLILEEWKTKKHDSIILVDGVHKVNGIPTQTVIAFDALQIKSALGNSGDFNPKSHLLSDMKDQPKYEMLNSLLGMSEQEIVRIPTIQKEQSKIKTNDIYLQNI